MDFPFFKWVFPKSILVKKIDFFELGHGVSEKVPFRFRLDDGPSNEGP